MKRAWCVLVLPVIWAVSASAEEPVYFADAAMKAAVEDALWTSDPTPTDMLGLTNFYAGNMGIKSVVGLECATNLWYLSLRLNDIQDISPLSGLTGLTHLVLHKNPITSLSPLSGMTKLTYLDLDHTNTSDISALSSLVNLETLLLYYNEVSDISALTTFTSLKCIEMRRNALNEEAFAVHIPQILANNPGIDFEYDPGPRLESYSVILSSTEGGSVVYPGEGTFTFPGVDHPSTRIEAKADPGFVFEGWSGSYFSISNPDVLYLDLNHDICAIFSPLANVFHVDDDAADDPAPNNSGASDPQEDGTADHPFDSIQEAIRAAADGATIVVRPGIYRENINLLGKKIHVTAVDPVNPHSGPCATIDGMNTGSVVTIPPGCGEQCSLSGFVIAGGNGRMAGGIHCTDSSPVISNCLVVGNRWTDPNGAAVYLSDSRAVLMNCTIADNCGDAGGAGLMLVDSNAVMTNSILWGNTPCDILACGTSDPSIGYCVVPDLWAGLGNNIQTDPLFARRGVWVNREDPSEMVEPGDIRAIWLAGDYHVQSQAGRWDSVSRLWLRDDVTSPCIDAGVLNDPIGYEPVPHGNRLNMGAYGGTSEAGKSP